MNTLAASMTCTMLAALAATTAHADDSRSVAFSGTARTGYEYDSNVGVPELDTNTGNADNAVLLDLGANLALPLAKPFTLKLGYGYMQTGYRQYTEFDLALHRASAELAYKKGRGEYAVALRRFAARLDNDRFLELRQVSPSVSRLIGERYYLRAAYTISEKSFADSQDRDATNNAIGADAYLLLDGMQHYIAIAYTADRDDATGEAFDYSGAAASLTWGRQLDLLGRGLAMKARLRLERRAYDNANAASDAPRRDRRTRASLSATLPVTEWFSIEGKAGYADNASNLPAADLHEAVYSVNLAAAF